METRIIDGKEFRLVTVRGRLKWIARDGEAYNPIHWNQKASIHYNPDGYPCFGGGVPVHLYVANGWVEGKFDGAEVDHIDYDRCNYNADNLRWVSHDENIRHSYIDEDHYSGKHTGAANGRAAMSADQVEEIEDMFDRGLSTMEVIKALHPDYSYSERRSVWNRFNRIKTRETWQK